MAKQDQPGEHPLMSNRTLRAIFASLTAAQAHLSTQKRLQYAQADAACVVAPLAGLVSMDAVFGCRSNGLLEHLRPKTHPPISNPLNRFYAAIGAALTSTGKPPQPVILAFFERHEIAGKGWSEAFALAAPLPLLAVVLPRWKGREDSLDLGKFARASGLPGIAVDAGDPIALYRVASESLIRARAGGGAALLEAIHLADAQPAIEKLARYLIDRGIVSEPWTVRSQSNLPNAPSKRKRS